MDCCIVGESIVITRVDNEKETYLLEIIIVVFRIFFFILRIFTKGILGLGDIKQQRVPMVVEKLKSKRYINIFLKKCYFVYNKKKIKKG